MGELVGPTRFADVNAVLEGFRVRLEALLAGHLVGMYAIGSLALGDFDPARSDIDLIVVTDVDLAETLVGGLAEMHAQFAASSSRWSRKTEAVYVPQAALRAGGPRGGAYPQIEQGTTLVRAGLEHGWVFQAWTLRERGVVVLGPPPFGLVDPIRAEEMRAAVAVMAGGGLIWRGMIRRGWCGCGSGRIMCL